VLDRVYRAVWKRVDQIRDNTYVASTNILTEEDYELLSIGYFHVLQLNMWGVWDVTVNPDFIKNGTSALPNS
jgi:hypothetical protein